MSQVKIFNSISQVEKECWDSLIEDNVFICYDWLKTFENTTTLHVKPFYIMIFEGGKLVAASVCYFEERNSTLSSTDNLLLGRLTRYKPFKNISFLPAVICGPNRGYGTHFIFSKEIEKNEISFLQIKLLDAVENISEENRSSICFHSVMDNESDLMNILTRRGYHKTKSLPLNYMDIQWSSFDEYKKNIFRKNRRSINHELNRNRKAGVTIKQLHNIDGYQQRLMELIEMNYRKYNSDMFPLKPNYFQQIKENFVNNAIINVAVKEDSIIGVSTIIRRGKAAVITTIGIDHNLSNGDLTYFNLNFYEPIRNAIENGLKRIYAGNALYKMKARRGYEAANSYIYYKPNNRSKNFYIKLWFLFHNRWMTHKFSYIENF